MALNIKNAETEQLAAEVAELAGESKTQAVTVALRERRSGCVAARPSRSAESDTGASSKKRSGRSFQLRNSIARR